MDATADQQQGDAPALVKDEEIDTNWDEAIETFDNMELREELLRGIYAYGFEAVCDPTTSKSLLIIRANQS
ncbi:hypothetical protein SO694_00021216 [Aureococcus anophagefferens]|uniref:Uncharacterized protein n=1 Tax=Aureococcus anophagefferens TaxID=44056 RepID=A0ABR1FUB2_AURAN